MSKHTGSMTDIAHNMSIVSDCKTGFYTGKRWTLKLEKEDETTPGPKYNPA